jgi:hypothetical protein
MGEGIFFNAHIFYSVVDEIVPCLVKVNNGHKAYGPRLIYYTSFLLLGNSIQLDVEGFKLRIQIKTMNMKWMLTYELFGIMISLTIQ